MKRICIIIPYYGKWPTLFNLFLKSCSYNNWINILFITDLSLPVNTPNNISKKHLTFSDLQLYVNQKTGTETALKSYYKLCDFKPLYGFLFQEFIKDYQFWGFGDIDLIYGNTRKFLTDDLLDEHDVITFRTEWLSGALTLFKNNEKVNSLFKKSPDWLKVISNNKHYSFTECAGQYNAIVSGVSIFDINAEVVTMTAVCKKEAEEGKLKIFEKKLIRESIPKSSFIKFDSGVVTDNYGEEYLLYHYISDKPRLTFEFPSWKIIPDIFYITQEGFYKEEEKFKFFFIRRYRLVKAHLNKIFKKAGFYK